ncbi:hypothetical protein F5B21DRAFT_474999 [Xylaria acuta]|nr:hypothetical protein F5B21DRAFT_474999 [Xylaria acuta]
MDYAETAVNHDSDWTPMYAILAAIPAIFIVVILFSTWRDRMRAERARQVENPK